MFKQFLKFINLSVKQFCDWIKDYDQPRYCPN
jgi:hypothetical protein